MKAPAVTVRFETKRQLEVIKSAAKLEKRSLNQFVVMVSEAAAKARLSQEASA